MKNRIFSKKSVFYFGMSVGLFILVLLISPAYSYSPPQFNDAHTEVENPNGHGTIILKAIDVLRNDGNATMADTYNQYLLQLYEGAYQADQGGSFSYLGVTLGRNYFSHFYEPSTGKGFYLTSDYSAAEGISFDWKVSTLRGPHAAATDMCNWYYAQAVQAMRDNSPELAMKYMGYALHVLSDLAVPHHATNIGAHQDRLGEELTINADASEKTTHGVYEDAVDTFLDEGLIVHATMGGIYHNDWIPSDFCTYTAQQSVQYIHDIKYQDTGPQYFLPVANIVLPLAERVCAGLMRRFYENWKNESFMVSVLKITRVKAIGSRCGKYLDCPDDADFYVKIRMGYRQFPTSGVIEGCDDANPNILSEYNWFYPVWFYSRTTSIPVEISLWDEDTVSSDDHADIDPGGGSDLDITYNIANGTVSGDVNATAVGNETQVFARGENSDSQDRAEITMSIARYPILPPGSGPDSIPVTLTTSISGIVKDECNQPLAAVTIGIPNTTFTTTTGSDGSYLLQGVILNKISGTDQFAPVEIQAEKTGYNPGIQIVSLTLNEGSGVHFILPVIQPPTFSLRVMVTNSNGDAVNNAQVSMVGTEYSISLANPGDYRLMNAALGCEGELSSSVAVDAPGYISQSKPVTFQPGDYQQISFVLSSVVTDEEEDQEGNEEEGEEEEREEEEREEEESGLSQYFQEGDFVTVQPFSFNTLGNGPIYGWTWLTQTGDRASWTFKLESEPVKVKAAALNFSLLVTNQVNGGSGYTSNPKVKIFDLNGNMLGSSTLYLVNTFRPKYPENTVGIGYPASDAIEHSLIKQMVSQGQSFMVTIEWPAPDKHHIAVKKDSVLLAYVIFSETSERSDQNSREQREEK